MPGGTCAQLDELPPRLRSLLDSARRGVLVTVGRDAPHAVPVVFVVRDEGIVSPIDDKPKEGPELARITNIQRDDRATLLVDYWDEDWSRLCWVMVRGRARVLDSNPVTEQLRPRWPQYTDEELSPGDRAIALTPQKISWWAWSEPD